MVNCYEFCIASLTPTQQGSMHGDFTYHLRKKNSGREEKKKKIKAGVFLLLFLRRGFNGFTICFGGAGSCIITCLLVHCLSSSVSQLKQRSGCSYFRKREHTNQAVVALFAHLSVWMAPSFNCLALTAESSTRNWAVKCRLSPVRLEFTKTRQYNWQIQLWKSFIWIIMTSIIVL